MLPDALVEIQKPMTTVVATYAAMMRTSRRCKVIRWYVYQPGFCVACGLPLISDCGRGVSWLYLVSAEQAPSFGYSVDLALIVCSQRFCRMRSYLTIPSAKSSCDRSVHTACRNAA